MTEREARAEAEALVALYNPNLPELSRKILVGLIIEALARAVEKAVAREREACAKILEDNAWKWTTRYEDAREIRRRGGTGGE